MPILRRESTKLRTRKTGRARAAKTQLPGGAPVSRKESQAHTRARLIEVGREHFLRFGLSGAVAEKVAAEAGFTRGALYANFGNMEELFVAVVQTSVDAELVNFRSILASDRSVEERFGMMREMVGNLVTNRTWVLLQTEFQANALRNNAIRAAFLEQQHWRRMEGAALVEQFARDLGLVLSASPAEIVAVLGSLAQGLGVQEVISGSRDPEAASRLAMLCFDTLVAGAPQSSQ